MHSATRLLTFPPPQVSQRTKGVPLLDADDDAKKRRRRQSRCIFGTNDDDEEHHVRARTHSLEGGRRIPRVATQSDHRLKSVAAVVHDDDDASCSFVWCYFCPFFRVSASHDARGPTADCKRASDLLSAAEGKGAGDTHSPERRRAISNVVFPCFPPFDDFLKGYNARIPTNRGRRTRRLELNTQASRHGRIARLI